MCLCLCVCLYTKGELFTYRDREDQVRDCQDSVTVTGRQMVAKHCSLQLWVECVKIYSEQEVQRRRGPKVLVL